MAEESVVASAVVSVPESVVIHPLVLLSVVAHSFKNDRGTEKRVVGVLLGESYKGRLDVTNSYAIPFEEDRKDPSVWFLDHNYHEELFLMFRKVNVKEKVLGWYSTASRIRPNDIEINELFKKYAPDPVLVTIDVNPVDELGIPTEAYRSVENSSEERTENRKTFVHLPSSVGAFEAEEVGVEHLLRDIRDATVSTLSNQVLSLLNSLKGLHKHLLEVKQYLQRVLKGEIPANHQVIYSLQDILSLSPSLSSEEMVKGFAVKTNDSMLVMYLSSLIRSVIALHNLINNKLDNKAHAEKKLKPKETEDAGKSEGEAGEKEKANESIKK